MVAAQARAGEGRQLEAVVVKRVRHRAGSAGVRRDENRARDGARE